MTEERWHLPTPLSREVALASARSLLLVGGLRANGSTNQVWLVDPVTGAETSRPPLARPVHDAAGAAVGNGLFLFAGGNTTTVGVVQELHGDQSTVVVANLPTPRSDLVAATHGGRAYLVGGYDGTAIQPSILMTGDGLHFRAIAQLPVPVRYAAVAVIGDSLWIFGGLGDHAPTSAIQQVNLATGHAAVVGQLAAPTDGAAAFVLGGRIYVAGGRTSGGEISDHVSRFDPATGALGQVGRLPYPVANAGSVTIGGTGYLLGGETPGRTDRVVSLRLVTTLG